MEPVEHRSGPRWRNNHDLLHGLSLTTKEAVIAVVVRAPPPKSMLGTNIPVAAVFPLLTVLRLWATGASLPPARWPYTAVPPGVNFAKKTS